MKYTAKNSNLIVLNEFNQIINKNSKMEVHQKGLLHRAFSVFIFHNDEILLQKRSKNKYHFPSVWSNACCSHPILEDASFYSVEKEARERLHFEMNIKLDDKLNFLKIIEYKAICEKTNLIENEIDYIFYKKLKEKISFYPNAEEVEDFKWIKKDILKTDLIDNAKLYTPWLKIIIEEAKIFDLF